MIYDDHIVPDLFHIGYQRTGTTWLQKGVFPLLSNEIIVPKTRQWEIYSANKRSDLIGVYDDIGKENIQNRIIIESEEALSGGRFRDYYENAKKLFWINPKAKVLISIRSQYTMLPSLYSLYVRKGGIMSFNQYVSVLLENKKLDYWAFVQAYKDLFIPRNVKVILFEDLVAKPEIYIRDILNFIGVKREVNLPDNEYQNRKPLSGYLSTYRLFNYLLSIHNITQRTGRINRNKLTFRLKRRNNIAKPILKLFDLLKLNNNLKLDDSSYNEIKDIYGHGNILLFDSLKRSITNSGYPGQ